MHIQGIFRKNNIKWVLEHKFAYIGGSDAGILGILVPQCDKNVSEPIFV